jgi:hypothetical protein
MATSTARRYGNNLVVQGANQWISGNNNTVHGENCYVRGDNNTVMGKKSEVVGGFNIIHGDGSRVYGNNNIIHASRCTVLGENNIINGEYCTVTGEGTIWNGAYGMDMTPDTPDVAAAAAAARNNRSRNRYQEELMTRAEFEQALRDRDRTQDYLRRRMDAPFQGPPPPPPPTTELSFNSPPTPIYVAWKGWNDWGRTTTNSFSGLHSRLDESIGTGPSILGSRMVYDHEDDAIDSHFHQTRRAAYLNRRMIPTESFDTAVHRLLQRNSSNNNNNNNNNNTNDNSGTRYPLPMKDEPETCPAGKPECVICKTREAIVTAYPCGHMVTCNDCTVKMKAQDSGKSCSICRDPVQGYSRVITSAAAETPK